MISFNFDNEADALYVEIQQGEFSKNKKLSNSVILDLDKDENILGLEIINVSKLGGLSPLLESQIKFWDITPQMDLLSDRESDEAYLAAQPGQSYALYFTDGGSVGLDLSNAPGTFAVTWISVSMGVTTRSSATGDYRLMDQTLEGGRVVTVTAPYQGGWVVALVKQ